MHMENCSHNLMQQSPVISTMLTRLLKQSTNNGMTYLRYNHRVNSMDIPIEVYMTLSVNIEKTISFVII